MRFTVSSQQLKFFQTQGYLEVEDLLTPEEARTFIKAAGNVRIKSPGYPEENLFRSIPLILELAKKKGWGQVAAELIHKKPLRLGFDKFYTASPPVIENQDEDACALLINLDTGKGFFFKQSLDHSALYNSDKSCYFFLVMTAKHLPDQLNPVVVR